MAGVFAFPYTLKTPQIDEHINQRILVGDRCAIAQPWTLDAQFGGLRVDALGGSALLVEVSVAVDVVAEASADVPGGRVVQPPLVQRLYWIGQFSPLPFSGQT